MNLLAPTRDFYSDNSFLHAILGLLVLGNQLNTLLEVGDAEVVAEDVDSDDHVLYAILGALHLTGRLRESVDVLPPAEMPLSPQPLIEASPTSVKDILR